MIYRHRDKSYDNLCQLNLLVSLLRQTVHLWQVVFPWVQCDDNISSDGMPYLATYMFCLYLILYMYFYQHKANLQVRKYIHNIIIRQTCIVGGYIMSVMPNNPHTGTISEGYLWNGRLDESEIFFIKLFIT